MTCQISVTKTTDMILYTHDLIKWVRIMDRMQILKYNFIARLKRLATACVLMRIQKWRNMGLT